jgi:hypothetical protein
MGEGGNKDAATTIQVGAREEGRAASRQQAESTVFEDEHLMAAA